MITDHGVRTMLEKQMEKAYKHELNDNFSFAIEIYKDVKSIAISFEDEGYIERCNEGITRCKKQMEFTM